MTITEIYNLFEQIALTKVGVNSFYKNNPYTAYNQQDVKYSSICFEITNCTDTETYRTFTATLYYADRLTETAENKFLIENTAVNTITDIIKDIREIEDIINIPENIQYTFFNQKFIDYLAGAYCTIDITVPINNCNRMY